MISVVGFDGAAGGSPFQPRRASGHRAVRRQRSLLSESLRSSPVAMSRASSFASASSEEDGWSEEAEEPGVCDGPGSASPRGAAPVAITYSRAAKARIDRAEAQGRRRDEQLEMLHAVRQYMAATKAQQAAAAQPLQQQQAQC